MFKIIPSKKCIIKFINFQRISKKLLESLIYLQKLVLFIKPIVISNI